MIDTAEMRSGEVEGMNSEPWRFGLKAGFAEPNLAVSPYPEGSQESDIWHAALMYGRGLATHETHTVVVCRLLLASVLLNLFLAAVLFW